MKPIVLCILFVFVAGCHVSQPQTVTIVWTDESEETGEWDEYTIVEFPDGERRWRRRHWGAVGDEFKARKDHGGMWY